jgi:hypothetical protein
MRDEVMEGPRDVTLTCASCRRGFTFTAGEQVYFRSKGLSRPKRCPECREYRRATLVPDPSVRPVQS